MRTWFEEMLDLSSEERTFLTLNASRIRDVVDEKIRVGTNAGLALIEACKEVLKEKK